MGLITVVATTKARLFTFLAGKTAKSAEVNSELNQIITAYNQAVGDINNINNSLDSVTGGVAWGGQTLAAVKTSADTAITQSAAAVSTANTASGSATAAVNTANTANTTAGNAVTTANSAVTTANGASTVATNAINKATQVETDYNAVKPTLLQAVADVNGKASVAYVDSIASNFQLGTVLPNSVTEAQIAPAFKNKVSALETEINTPSQTTITLDKSTKVLTVTDSYASPSDLVIGGESLYNAVTNGDFSGGTTGWSTEYTSNFTTSNNVATFLANANSGQIKQFKRFEINRKYFVSAQVEANSNQVRLTALDSGFVSHTGSGTFETLSFIVIAPTTDDQYGISIRDVRGSAFSNIRVKNAFIIPMTGAPYENYTADQMNGLVNKYIDKLKGAKAVVVGSRGRNLFDKDKVAYDKALGDAGELIAAIGFVTSDFIRVSASTNYIKKTTTLRRVVFYNRNKTYIDRVGTTSQFTTPANCEYIKLEFSLTSDGVTLDNFNVNVGTVLLAYEVFQGSLATISATRHKLPNLVEDELKFVDGKWVFIKRTAEKVLTSADITSYGEGSGYATVSTTMSTDAINYGSTTIFGNNVTWAFFPGFTAGNANAVGSANYFYKLYVGSPATSFSLTLPANTYANLAAAQAALAGTKIVYQLATPLIIEEQNFAQYGITVDGSLSSNLDYTEYFVADHDIMADVSIDYATNLAKAVEQLKDSSDGLRKAVDGKASKIQEPWIEPTLLVGWVNYGEPLERLSYMKDELGFVHFKGTVKNGSLGLGMLSMPTGYKPLKNQSFVRASSGSISIITVNGAGQFVITSGSNTDVSFDDISFRAEA